MLDGYVEDPAYDEAREVRLAPYADGSQPTVHLLRTATYLWACFTGLNPSSTKGAVAGLRIDVNNSRELVAQADDYGFFVGEDGVVFALAGDGAGGFEADGPGGLEAVVVTGPNGWTAELRIELGVLEGAVEVLGLSVGHYGLDDPDTAYAWPYRAVSNSPETWAATIAEPAMHLIALPLVRRLVAFAERQLKPGASYFAPGSSSQHPIGDLEDGS